MIYWVDTKANTISRISRDLTKREVIVRDGINSVEGLAIDWISGNIEIYMHVEFKNIKLIYHNFYMTLIVSYVITIRNIFILDKCNIRNDVMCFIQWIVKWHHNIDVYMFDLLFSLITIIW